ncbi:hypothetical protein ABBQ32_006965 [Trebouxia sp. C0010 RCD-2024]
MAVAANQPEAAVDPSNAIYVNQGDDEPVQMESLCMNCHENGTTTMLLTRVPHFRDIMVASFECGHCNFRNNEVSFTGTFGEQGVKYTLTVAKGDQQALSRQVVKSDNAVVTIPELEFEIPAATQKGSITTVEGLLMDAASNIKLLQEERRAADPATAKRIDEFLAKLDACQQGECAFTVLVDDPAGNSYVESPGGNPHQDAILQAEHYDRSHQQQIDVGLLAPEEAQASADQGEIAADDPHHGPGAVGASALQKALARIQGDKAEQIMSKYTAPDEVLELPGHCLACNAEAVTRVFQTSIPYFKEVVIMSNACDLCGYRSSDIKAGGGVSEKGSHIVLDVSKQDDLRRDVIKAESASVSIPEADLEVTTGSMGGLVTTVEGLLEQIITALRSTQTFQLGDSASALDRSTWGAFFQKLEDCMALKQSWTLKLTDPLSNSFVAPCTENPESDPRLTVQEYERSAEEDEEYGIDHLKRYAGEGLNMDSIDLN